MEFITQNLSLLMGGSAAGAVVWVLKLIPNDDIQDWVGTTFYWLGSAMTLGLSKFRFTKGLWNKTIEPYFIDLVDNTVGTAVKSFIKGLRSDK